MDISVTVFLFFERIYEQFVCTVADFSGEDKASVVAKFCTVVHERPGQGISHFGQVCSPEAQNRTSRPARVGI